MLKPELVAAMWHDYDTLKMSLSKVARKYGRSRKSISEVFIRRGHVLRPFKRPPFDPVTGRVIPLKEPTNAELKVIISKLKRVIVPQELKTLWRRWSLKKRGDFIAQVRKHLANPHDRPTTPFSKNVVPFDYTTPAARKIVERMNKGTTSQTKKAQLKPSCQGVIYKGTLWYWAPERNHGAYYTGRWTPEHGRPSLHHTIWEEHFGPVPVSNTVIFKDGNYNNFLPSNLALRTRAQCAMENSPTVRFRDNPTDPKLIAMNKNRIAKIIESRRRRSVNLTSTLLAQHNSGQSSLVALKK